MMRHPGAARETRRAADAGSDAGDGGVAVGDRRTLSSPVVARPHPWPGGVEPASLRRAARAVAAGLAAARAPAATAGADRAGGRDDLRQRPSQPRPAAQPPPARAHCRGAARQAVGHHRRLQYRGAGHPAGLPRRRPASRRTMPATSCRSGSTAAWRTGSPAAPMRWPSAHPTTGRSGWSWAWSKAGAWKEACGRGPSTAGSGATGWGGCID